MKTSQPQRLIKLLLPADLVRQMDHAILSADGAYQDRGEFVAESIRDRLAEEEAAQGGSPVDRDIPTHAKGESPAKYAFGRVGDGVELGRWRTGQPATTPAGSSAQVSFGLHNRDYPSLWALDLLATMSAETGRAPQWEEFTAQLRGRGLALAEQLRHEDLTKETEVRAAIGFPKGGPKQATSVDRFVTTSVGSNRRADGPFFILGLADFVNEDRTQLAPTGAGLLTLGDVIDCGLTTRLPQPPAAFRRWWSFLGDVAPAERAAWTKVLQAIADRPDRTQLLSRFPEWPGQTASTNTVGFVSRSREWGLVQPKLNDGRYQLTDFGSAVAREG